MKKLLSITKGIVTFLLVNERVNSQRCVAKDIDTTKTILESK